MYLHTMYVSSKGTPSGYKSEYKMNVKLSLDISCDVQTLRTGIALIGEDTLIDQ